MSAPLEIGVNECEHQRSRRSALSGCVGALSLESAASESR